MTTGTDSHDPVESGADSWSRFDEQPGDGAEGVEGSVEEDVEEEGSGGESRVPDGWTVDVDQVFDTPADGCRAVLEGAPDDADFDEIVDVVQRCVRGAGASMVRRHGLRARYDESYDVDSDVRVFPLEKYM